MSYNPHDTDKGRAPWGRCIDCKTAVKNPLDAPFCPNCKVFHEDVMGGIEDTKSNTDARLSVKKSALKRIREDREKEEFYDAKEKRRRSLDGNGDFGLDYTGEGEHGVQ